MWCENNLCFFIVEYNAKLLQQKANKKTPKNGKAKAEEENEKKTCENI